MKKHQIIRFFETHREEFLDDLAELIAIDSSKGQTTASMPYGKGPAMALEKALQIAEKYGLYTENWDNYLGIIQLNDSRERKLDIFAHLDVVPGGNGWNITEPFKMKIENQRVYGRGTADDKGPALAAIYALRAIKESETELTHNVRLMVGCDEECGSSELKYYFSKTNPAEMTFSPDGEFPVVNVEKGLFYGLYESEYPSNQNAGPRILSIDAGVKGNVIPGDACAVVENLDLEEIKNLANEVSIETNVTFSLSSENNQVTILAKGISGHASAPAQANNAGTGLLQLLVNLPIEDLNFDHLRLLQKMFPHGDYHGKSLGIYMKDECSGEITVSLNVIRCANEKLNALFDSRLPVCADKKTLSKVREQAQRAGFLFHEKIRSPHYTPENSILIQTLLKVYEMYTGHQGKCVSTGGTTYVHGIPNAVGFGCTYPEIDNHMHGPDEFAEIETLLSSGMMFTSAILELCQ